MIALDARTLILLSHSAYLTILSRNPAFFDSSSFSPVLHFFLFFISSPFAKSNHAGAASIDPPSKGRGAKLDFTHFFFPLPSPPPNILSPPPIPFRLFNAGSPTISNILHGLALLLAVQGRTGNDIFCCGPHHHFLEQHNIPSELRETAAALSLFSPQPSLSRGGALVVCCWAEERRR